MSKPTATKLNFYEASSDGVIFPTVTICNFNKFNKSYFDTDEMSTKKGQLKDFLKITTPVWGHRQEFDADSWDTKYDKVSGGELGVRHLLSPIFFNWVSVINSPHFTLIGCPSLTLPILL